MISDTSNIDISYLRLLFTESGTDTLFNNYKKLADFFPALVYVYDTDKKRVGYVNKQFHSLLGYTEDDLSGIDYDWSKIVIEDDVKSFQEALDKLGEMKDDESYSYNNRLSRKEGDWRYFRTKGTVLKRNAGGKAEALLFVAEDITDQLTNSEELQRTKELINETERMHNFGMYSYDLKTDQFTWSDGVYALLEVDKEKHPAPNYQFLLDLALPEEVQKLEEMKHSLETQIKEFENEFSILTADGNIKILLNIIKAVHNDDGVAVKYVGSLRDITKDRLYERELQRTIKDLDTSNKELEEFAYVASHDMQEPLRKITTFSTRLHDKFSSVLGPEGKMYLERMNVAAGNMRALIENLLEVSRATRNDHPFVKTDINEILKTVISNLEISIEEQNVAIEIPEPLPVIEAVPSLVGQLFSNLLTNAIKFRTNVNPAITIMSRTIDKNEREELLLPEKTFYEITVADNGIGFEQEFAEKVFQIFQRLHGKAEYPGSGIGLSICKKIVDKHNGIIYAKSQLGKGSTFYIILPENQ